MSLTTTQDNLGNVVNYLAVAPRGFFEYGGSTYRKINDVKALLILPDGHYQVIDFPTANDVTLLNVVDVTPTYPAAASLPVDTAYRTDGIDYLIVDVDWVMRVDGGEFLNSRPDNGDVGVIGDPSFNVHP